MISAQPVFGGLDGWGSIERPEGLFTATRLTHFINESVGEGPEMAELNLNMKSEAFMKLKPEPGVPIAEFN